MNMRFVNYIGETILQPRLSLWSLVSYCFLIALPCLFRIVLSFVRSISPGLVLILTEVSSNNFLVCRYFLLDYYRS